MEFSNFLKKYQKLPIMSSKLLLNGEENLSSMRVQLARWVKAGHLIQLRRGIYVFAPHFQKITPSPFLLAATIMSPSYVSLEKAMEFHGLIPEAVFSMTCVTTKRPAHYETPLGRFNYQHVHSRLFWGYSSIMFENQTGFMAHPEKALLDLIYLSAPKLTDDYLDELRLQNPGKINTQKLMEYGERFEKPGMLKAAKLITRYLEKTNSGEKDL